MVHVRELTLAVLLLAAPASALYAKSGPVQLIDLKSFDKEVLQSDNAAIVEFFAPWCGHCKSLAPHYEKVAKNLKGIAKVAAVDCDQETNKYLCESQGIQGFPTLKIFKPSSRKGKPIVEDYQGPRTAKAIVDAVVDRIPNHVTRLTSDKVNDWLTKNNETTKGILFTPKGTTSALYKALAIEFFGRAEFAQIRDKEEDAVKLFGVEKFPTFIVLPGGEAPGKVYDGAMKIDALKKFVGDIALAKKETKKESKKAEKKEKKEKKEKEKKEKKEKEEKGEQKEEKEEPEGERSTEDTPPPPTPEETPKVAPLIPELADEATLVSTCFAPKSKTCVLAFVPPFSADPSEDPSLAGLNTANEKVSATTKTFKFYRLSSESAHAKTLAEALELTVSSEKPTVITVNGHRRWYRVFSGNTGAADLLAWLDAITMGEVKKQKMPKGLFQEKAKGETVVAPPHVESSAEELPQPPPVEESNPETPEHEEL